MGKRISAPLALMLLWVAGSAPAEVYRWTDEQGRVHFGDQPGRGAEPVTLDVRTVTTVTVRYLDEWKVPEAAKPAGLVMYSTEWCGYCKKARRYMADQGIAFTEKDIEKSEAARREYRQRGGTGGVPYFVKGSHAMQGFNAGRLRAFLRTARQRD